MNIDPTPKLTGGEAVRLSDLLEGTARNYDETVARHNALSVPPNLTALMPNQRVALYRRIVRSMQFSGDAAMTRSDLATRLSEEAPLTPTGLKKLSSILRKYLQRLRS